MQAGGDVLGGALAAEDVALEHLRQLVAGHVGEVPARRGCAQGPLTGHQGPCPPPTRSGPPPPRPPQHSVGRGWGHAALPYLSLGAQPEQQERAREQSQGGWAHAHTPSMGPSTPARGSTQPTGPPPAPGPHSLRVRRPHTHPECEQMHPAPRTCRTPPHPPPVQGPTPRPNSGAMPAPGMPRHPCVRTPPSVPALRIPWGPLLAP